ncbi:hypothetical protein JCM6882_000147 [Rhodosporidiobolus microsporus]
MTGLEDLPPDVLNRLVHFLNPAGNYYELVQKVGDRIRRPYGAVPHNDVISLASTAKSMREALEPVLFHTLVLCDEETVTKEKVQWLAEKGKSMLDQTRVLMLGDIRLDAFDLTCSCIKRMVNLEILTHCAHNPLSPRFVDALSTLPRIKGFHCHFAGVESLPHLLPLANRLESLMIDTSITAPLFADCWDVCPITVLANRRNNLPRDEKNVPTLREQAEATVNGLAALLFAAKDTIQILAVHGAGFQGGDHGPGDPYVSAWLSLLFRRLRKLNGGEEYPAFLNLEGLRIAFCDPNCAGMVHLLRTSTKIEELEIALRPGGALLPAVEESLKKLEWLYILADDFNTVGPFARRIIEEAPLRSLILNGIQQHEIPQVFANALPDLRELRLVCYGVPYFELQYFDMIATRCPGLRSFELTGQFYRCEVVEIFAALRPLRHLRHFAFDHPWEKPRSFPFPSPDGKTIRTNRNDDFRVISTRGGSINAEVKRRIREDIDAVTPIYHKRFSSIAKKHPSLRTIEWHATDEVVWDWTFLREDDLDTGRLVRMQHEPEIAIEVGGPGDAMPHAPGVFLTMPTAGGGMPQGGNGGCTLQ